MKPKRKCILCGKRPAEVPDRERPGRLMKRVCLSCHAERLADDVRRIFKRKNDESLSSL